MTFVKLFKVFLWKNLLFVWFNWKVLSVIFFGCVVVLFVYLKSTYNVVSTPSVIYESKSTDILKEYFPANDGDFLFYTPISLVTNAVMEEVRRELQFSEEKLRPLGNATEMRLIAEQNCDGVCFAIKFENVPETDGGNLRFSISCTTIRVSPKKLYVNDEDVAGIKDDDEYIRSGFFTLQHLIDKSYIKTRTARNNLDYELEISSMPTIAQEATDGERVLVFGSLFFVLFSVLLLSTFLVPLVEEKKDGLKEFLVIATPLNFLNGLTFFLVRLVLYLLFMFVVIGSACIYNALGVVPLVFVVLLFVLYIISAMCFAFMISVCFNSVFYAKVGGLLLLIVPYIFCLVKGKLSVVATYIFCTKSFLDGVEIFQTFTNKRRNFTFTDMFVNITESSFTLCAIYGFLIIQCFVYALLYNYLSSVFPGPGGLKKPYLFPFKASFYKKKQGNQYTTSELNTDAIIIQDLVKTFRTPSREIKIADRLNMVIKNKQITVLLGHNGAGKTTTLNMIMGSEPKDSGKITVCSERDVASYRHLIGFCPQHSVFMHYMTCTQHLQFFSQLRGSTRTESLLAANSLLEQLKLMDKAREYGKNLSGGMKRRLSLGIAISGDTKVVVLDEPSSGLDIESRRELWDILLKLRRRMAVLVTTHHMEEAEVLGDTICILSNGRLQRTGSPLELKRKVGSGYILKLCTDSHLYSECETLNLIQKNVPTARVLNVVPPTVLISLPYIYKPQYSKMLTELEHSKYKFGIQSISITDTSLEDVFLNCEADVDQVDSSQAHPSETSRLPYQRLNPPVPVTWLQQFKAVSFKKIIFLRSEWLYTTLMLSLPFLSMALAILLMHSMSVVENGDELALNLKQFKEGLIYIQSPSDGNEQSKRIENILSKTIEDYNIKVHKLNNDGSITVNQQLLALQQQNLGYFLQNVVGVFEIQINENGTPHLILYFSGNIYHSSVILLNLIDSAILNMETNGQNAIETKYLPMKRFIKDISPSRLEYFAVILPIGLFFCMFFYVSLPFKEHESGFKNLQSIPSFNYWFTVVIFDIILHFTICVLLFIFQAAIMPTELYNGYEQTIIILSIFFYGCSYLPILYSFANGFTSISTISSYLLFNLIVSSIVPLITSSNFAAMQYHEVKIMFLSLLPDFNLNHQLRIINENFVISRRNRLTSLDQENSLLLKTQRVLDINAFFTNAILVFVVSLFFFIYILENKEKRQALRNLFKCYNCKQVKANSPVTPEEVENLVQEENARVDEILREKTQEDYPLLVSSLFKFYDRTAAVCGLNFAVRKEECFGLLGVNGAGKTSTFQMITANATISSGTIKIDGIDILENEVQYKNLFGYCPQYDCLNAFMTSYQMLKYMAMLRGLNTTDVHNEVMFWLEKLDLLKYQNVEIRYYSGGTKRKLSAAVAMIASPSLVLLDEPTTGVDPVSRRFLWNCIQEFQKRERTVILTSHSMDECEQLCNRLAIMASGKFKCLGYISELKQLYGSGFTIKVKMKIADSERNVSKTTIEMTSHFPECELRENHAGMLTYFIKNDSLIAWSDVFNKTEKFFAASADLVEDYSVNESSLEDIFLKFDSRIPRQPSLVEI